MDPRTRQRKNLPSLALIDHGGFTLRYCVLFMVSVVIPQEKVPSGSPMDTTTEPPLSHSVHTFCAEQKRVVYHILHRECMCPFLDFTAQDESQRTLQSWLFNPLDAMVSSDCSTNVVYRGRGLPPSPCQLPCDPVMAC